MVTGSALESTTPTGDERHRRDDDTKIWCDNFFASEWFALTRDPHRGVLMDGWSHDWWCNVTNHMISDRSHASQANDDWDRLAHTSVWQLLAHKFQVGKTLKVHFDPIGLVVLSSHKPHCLWVSPITWSMKITNHLAKLTVCDVCKPCCLWLSWTLLFVMLAKLTVCNSQKPHCLWLSETPLFMNFTDRIICHSQDRFWLLSWNHRCSTSCLLLHRKKSSNHGCIVSDGVGNSTQCHWHNFHNWTQVTAQQMAVLQSNCVWMSLVSTRSFC